MPTASDTRTPSTGPFAKVWRASCTVAAIVVIEALVCGMALFPILLTLAWIVERTPPDPIVRTIVIAVLALPAYALFAVGLIVSSSTAMRLTRTSTPVNAEMRIADLDWPLLRWVRCMVATHVVRVFAGALFRGSPIWTLYLRLNGARVGRRVYVNTPFISDHNLLELGDEVVIGAGVHLSGHTVERGVVKTAPVRLGSRVTIGLGTVIDIDVEIGDGTQVAALSLVPKHSRLEPGAVYVGIPVRRLEPHADHPDARRLG